MMFLFQRSFFSSALIALALTACHNPARLNEEEKKVVEQLTNSLRTRCTGRYLIDLPSGVKIDGEATIQKVSITSKPLSREEYQKVLEKIVMDRRDRTGDAPRNDYPYVYESGSVPGIKEGYFFVTNSPGAGGEFDSQRVVEAYNWDRGHMIFLQVEAYDIRGRDYDSNPDYGPLFKEMDQGRVPTDIPQKKTLVIDLLNRIQGRPDDVIPTTPGLCFAGGFLPGKSGMKEEVDDVFLLPSHPDVVFVFGTFTDDHDPASESMPNRLPKIKAYLKEAGGRLIRTGTVQLKDMRADELLLEGEFSPGVKGNNFHLEANTLTGGPQTPYLTFEMSNGSHTALIPDDTILTKASLTESEAIAIWDLVSRTLRPRPNGF